MYFFLLFTELFGLLVNGVAEFFVGDINPVEPNTYLILIILCGETSYF
jgi:hypothetical protein